MKQNPHNFLIISYMEIRDSSLYGDPWSPLRISFILWCCIMFVRKNNRLPNKHIYWSNHWYFVTICVQDRQCILWNIVESDTVGHNHSFSNIWYIVESTWYNLPQMFTNIVLDQFVVMPNHIHGIIGFEWIPYSSFTGKVTNLWNIIKRFKLESINKSKQASYVSHSFRQKSFYDHVIRNQQDLERIQEYIINNPLQRTTDSLYSLL